MKKIYVAAGNTSIFMGTGRKEFNPKKAMPGFEHYLKESIDGTLALIPNPEFDEGYMSNFMAGRFIKQGNLAGFLPEFVPSLLHKPCYRHEGACGSGGLALTSAAKSLLSGMADKILVCGFEIQNTVKALYGADILAGAAYHSKERKNGDAFFFPGLFSDRAGAYYQKAGYEIARKGMAKWYENAILNARKSTKSQEYHNVNESLFEAGMTQPNPKRFVEHLNLYDCSKVSDGAASLVMCSEKGRKGLGLELSDCIELTGFYSSEGNITQAPKDPTKLTNTAHCTSKALSMSGVKLKDLGILEVHDCFSITGLLALEALGVCPEYKAGEYVYEGETSFDGSLPTNLSGGLCGFGHPTGATGVRQMCDLQQQLCGKAENPLKTKKDHGLMISMGGNDISLSSLCVKRTSS
ncbi:MAG: hypothetical protein MK132_00955 [Lentisphaerales bacterium]|nr:hypothetical protein [Lentisphaerales bacterium]